MSKRLNIWPRKALAYKEMTHDETLMYAWITWLLRKNYDGFSYQNGNVARLIIKAMREKKVLSENRS